MLTQDLPAWVKIIAAGHRWHPCRHRGAYPSDALAPVPSGGGGCTLTWWCAAPVLAHPGAQPRPMRF
jgi:hypothetical protein